MTLTPRDARLRRLYNVTEEEWNQVLAHQGGVCAVVGCGRTGVTRALHTDHDHSSGLFRGILCARHNILLREAHTASMLRSLADYLDNPTAPMVLGERYGTVGRISKKRRKPKRRKR